jgi:hypothetical protein
MRKQERFNTVFKFYLKVNVDVKHRTITPYYNQVINNSISLCAFVNGTDNNLVISWILKMIGKTFPKRLIHPCPYDKEFKALNLSVELSPEMSAFLLGRYLMTMTASDAKDRNIITAILEFEMTADKATGRRNSTVVGFH